MGKEKKDVLIIDKLQQLADCFLKKEALPLRRQAVIISEREEPWGFCGHSLLM